MGSYVSAYARDFVEHEPRLGTMARLVLMLVAERSNNRTGETYTGTWLIDAAGGHFVTVRRALVELVELGAITIEHRPGKSSIVRFPVTAKLSTPRASTRGVEQIEHSRAPRAHARGPRAWARDVPGPVPVVSEFARVTHDANECACDATGWIYDETTRSVTPCPKHHDRAAGQ